MKKTVLILVAVLLVIGIVCGVGVGAAAWEKNNSVSNLTQNIIKGTTSDYQELKELNNHHDMATLDYLNDMVMDRFRDLRGIGLIYFTGKTVIENTFNYRHHEGGGLLTETTR